MVPVRPTNIVQTIHDITRGIVKGMGGVAEKKPLKGVNVVVCATDVHEFGKEICKSICIEAGANVFDLGSQVSTEEIADAIRETESGVVLISTFNGIALSYAREVVETLKRNNLSVRIIMGGLLNENRDGSDLPVDVSADVAALGIDCSNRADKLVENILAAVAG